VYNIDNKFDGGACAYKNCQRLPVAVYLDLRSYGGRLAVREATAEVVSRGCRLFAIADPNPLNGS